MVILSLGLAIFFGMHLVPSFAGFRRKTIARFGEVLYKGLYAVVALVGVILIVYGKSQAEFQVVWEPPVWSKNVVFITMVFAFYLFAAADMKSNVKRFIRHPMLLGVLLWSGVHLFANGDFASMLLFGSFFIFSWFAMFSANVRGASKQEKKYPFTKDVFTVFAGLAAYIVFIKYLHPYLIGVAII